MMTEKNQALLEETLQKSGVEADHTQLVLGMGGAGIRLAEELAEVLGRMVQQPVTVSAMDSDSCAVQPGRNVFLLKGTLPGGITGAGAAGDRRLAHLWMMEQLEALTRWITPLMQLQKPLDIWLTAGMGGGTGSGCLLSMAYLVRHVTADMAGVTLRCCLTMPGLTSGWPNLVVKQLETNSRRSVQELAYCVDLPAADQVDRQLDNRPLLDGCWLRDSSEKWQPVGGSREALGELLARTDSSC